MTRKFSFQEAQRHTITRVRIGQRADGTACEHPYEPDEPSGYLQWGDWADRKAKTHKQSRCPECGLWAIYRPLCCAKRCRRLARQAFDVRNPWPDGKPVDLRHYEVCDQHAEEFFSRQLDSPNGGYVERSAAERIRGRLVAA